MPQWIRDTALFIAGIVGVFYEASRSADPRFWLIVLYASMIGVTAFIEVAETAIGLGERLRGKPVDPEHPDPPLTLRMAYP